MKPSTERAFELLRAGTSTPLPRDREERMRSNIETAVGVALPAALSAPSAITAVKALTATKAALPASLASLGKTVVITLVSMAVGSAATVVVKRALTPRAAATVSQPRTSPAPVPAPDVRAPLVVAHAEPVAHAEGALVTDGEAPIVSSPTAALDNPEQPTLDELPPPPSPLPQAAVLAAATAPKQLRLAPVLDPVRTPALPAVSPSGAGGSDIGPFSEPPLVVAEPDRERARCSEASERQALTEARQAFEAALPAEALALLDHQHQQCPTGEWSPTSWRLRIKTLCVLNRTAEAKGLMYWYWGEHTQEARLAQSDLADSCPASVLLPPPTAPSQLE